MSQRQSTTLLKINPNTSVAAPTIVKASPSTAVNFSVPGAPRGKARPHARAFLGRVQRYKDTKTVAYESLVRLVASEAMETFVRFEGPVSVEVDVFIEPVASTSRTRSAQMVAGLIKPTKAPDLDNIVKSILDGCNGVVFRDDVLVVKIAATKSYAVSSSVYIKVSDAS